MLYHMKLCVLHQNKKNHGEIPTENIIRVGGQVESFVKTGKLV